MKVLSKGRMGGRRGQNREIDWTRQFWHFDRRKGKEKYSEVHARYFRKYIKTLQASMQFRVSFQVVVAKVFSSFFKFFILSHGMRRSFKVLVFHSLEKKKRRKNSQIEILFTKKNFTTLVQLGTLFGIDQGTYYLRWYLVNSLVNEVYNRVGFSSKRERI